MQLAAESLAAVEWLRRLIVNDVPFIGGIYTIDIPRRGIADRARKPADPIPLMAGHPSRTIRKKENDDAHQSNCNFCSCSAPGNFCYADGWRCCRTARTTASRLRLGCSAAGTE